LQLVAQGGGRGIACFCHLSCEGKMGITKETTCWVLFFLNFVFFFLITLNSLVDSLFEEQRVKVLKMSIKPVMR